MQDLNVTLAQLDLRWESPAENCARIERLFGAPLAPSPDAIFLPEMFSTGFSMNSHMLAESMEGPTLTWLSAFARSTSAVVSGSIIAREGAKTLNRLVWATPDGDRQYYDKRHLFGLLGEDKHYAEGNSRKIFALNGWRVCPLICYDLRFPVWCRNRSDYDLLFVAANWPLSRDYVWRTLLQARAIENQCYVIGVNRVGKDPQGLEFGGGSLVIDPLGRTVLDLGQCEAIASTTVKADYLLSVRDQYPFLKDADRFEIED